MKKLFFNIICSLIILFLFLKQVKAAFSFKIASISANIISSTEEVILVNLSITDLPGDSYFRVAFQKKDGSPYFGYLKNHLDQWIKVNENCNNFYFLNNKNTTELTIRLKIADFDPESGEYNIKAHRYTPSCSSTPSTNYLTVQINLLKPTPTFTPTPETTKILTPAPTLTSISASTPTLNSTLTPTPTISNLISYNNIFISEVMVYPENQEDEWVELFNNNDFSVILKDWFIDDIEDSGSSPKKINLEIPGKSYQVIIISSAMFNNPGDSVRLLDFNKNLKDSFEYKESVKGKTFGRISFENNDFCLQEPSFYQPNNNCSYSTPTPIKTNLNLSINNNKDNKNFEITPTITLRTSSIKNRKTYLKNDYKKPPSYQFKNNSYQEILGVSTIKKTNINLLLFLIINSFIYSILTIIGILFKIKIIYVKNKRLYLSFIHTK